MPRGARKGERRGGIAKGGRHKKTIERAILAASAAGATKPPPEAVPSVADIILGKTILNDFAMIYRGLASMFQPSPNDKPLEMSAEARSKWDKQMAEFEKWSRLCIDCAKWKAPYESPQLRAILTAPADDGPRKNKRFTLDIFEEGKLIEHHPSGEE